MKPGDPPSGLLALVEPRLPGVNVATHDRDPALFAARAKPSPLTSDAGAALAVPLTNVRVGTIQALKPSYRAP
jgi:hypothetical protein